MDFRDRYPALAKTADFFSRGFTFGQLGGIRSTFWPISPGASAPPINAVRSSTGQIIRPETALALSSVWACTWLIASTLSTLPFILNRKKSGNYGEPADDNPLYTVLGSKPNQQMSASTFWQVMLASLGLWGNGYAVKTTNSKGDVVILDPLRPEYVIPYKDADTGLIRYKYIKESENDDFPADKILHLKDRTLDGLVGLSRIEFARNSLGLAAGAEGASAQVYRSGLRAGGFLKSINFLKADQRALLKKSLDSFTGEGRDAGGLMVLEGGLDFEALSMKPADVELLASRAFSVEDICRWFGVPPVLIGHASAGQTMWGTGIEQILLGFLSLTLRPYVRSIEMEVGRSLIKPGDQASLYLTIDTDDLLGADSAARSALYSSYAQNGLMTRNEIRAKEDLPAMDGGDSLTVQSNLVQLDRLGLAGAQDANQVKNILRAFLGIEDASASKGKS